MALPLSNDSSDGIEPVSNDLTLIRFTIGECEGETELDSYDRISHQLGVRFAGVLEAVEECNSRSLGDEVLNVCELAGDAGLFTELATEALSATVQVGRIIFHQLRQTQFESI